MAHSHPRFIISEDGALKLLDLFHNTIVIKNTKENGKIIIDLSSIIEIIPKKENLDEISMTYISNGQKKTKIFFCQDRLYLLHKIITMKDRSSKIISDYSIETFKCYLMINMDEKKKVILKKIGKYLSESKDSKNQVINSQNIKINDYKVYCTLYRTYMSTTQLSNKELKNYYIDMNQITKIKIKDDIYGLIFENINKIEIAIIPFNKNDLLVIKNLIISYAEKYLCYEIKYIEKDDYLKEYLSSNNVVIGKNKIGNNIVDQEKYTERKMSKYGLSKNSFNNDLILKKDKSYQNNKKITKSLFSMESKEIKVKYSQEIEKKEYLFIHYNVNRIGYNENKSNLILKSNSEYIYLFSINNEKIAQIKLADIFAIVVNGTTENYFEIFLENKSRFIFEVEKKNDILNDIIELLLKYKNNNKFLVFSYKISLKMKYNFLKKDELGDTYEESLIEQLRSVLFNKENIRSILEEIILNFFFRIGTSLKIEKLLSDSYLINNLIEKVDYYYKEIIKIIEDAKKDAHNKENNIKNNIIILNLLFIFFKHLGVHLLFNKICDKIFELLSNELKDRYNQEGKNYPIILNDYSLFYNAISILEYFPLCKQMMFLKVLSFNRESRIINLEEEIDLDSMFINMLLIKIENKLIDINRITDIDMPETSYYYFLYTLYKIFYNEQFNISRNGISLLSTIIEKLEEKRQREIKDILLKKTLILFLLIKIFMSNNNKDFIITKNCIKLFQILIPQYYEMTIPIKNIFPNNLIQILGNEKDPDKWDKIQCDKFFNGILKDYFEEKIIWNNDCKKELITSLNNLIEEYEKTIKKIINLNSDLNTNSNDIVDLINMILKSDNYNSMVPDDFYKKKYIDNKPFYNIDYKNFKINYKTLKKEVYISNIYINQLIINNKKEINIQKPQKFWKSLMKELINNNEEQRIIILKAMLLIYKKYYVTIGEFVFYQILCRVYKSTNSDKVHSYIIQLFYISISVDDDEIKKTNLSYLNNNEILNIFIIFIKDFIEKTKIKKVTSLDFDIELYSKNDSNDFFLTQMKDDIKFYDEHTINYLYYTPFDEESWKNSDEKYKVLSLIISMFTILFINDEENMKNEFRIDTELIYPNTDIKKILYQEKYIKLFLKIILLDNQNLNLQILDLFVNCMNKALFNSCHNFCLVDILFIFMIKYKSFKIMKNIQNLSKFYFENKEIKKLFTLSDEENIFLNHLSIMKKISIKKEEILILFRYLPIQIIYFYLTHTFGEFIDILYTKDEIKNSRIIWSRKMIEDLLKGIKNIILDKNKEELKIIQSYRYDYSEMNKKEKSLFVYYIRYNKDFIDEVDPKFYLDMINILKLDKNIKDCDCVKLIYQILEKNIDNEKYNLKEINSKITSILELEKLNEENYNKDNLMKKMDLELFYYYIMILSLIQTKLNEINKSEKIIINLSIYINTILSINSTDFNPDNIYSKLLYSIIKYLLNIKTQTKPVYNNAMFDVDSQIIQRVSRIFGDLYKANQNLLLAFILYFIKLCQKNEVKNNEIKNQIDNISNLYSMTILPFQLLYLCSKYIPAKDNQKEKEENKIYYESFKLLNILIKNNPWIEESINKLLVEPKLIKLLNDNDNDFLFQLSKVFNLPDSILEKKDLQELTLFLDEKMSND